MSLDDVVYKAHSSLRECVTVVPGAVWTCSHVCYVGGMCIV